MLLYFPPCRSHRFRRRTLIMLIILHVVPRAPPRPRRALRLRRRARGPGATPTGRAPACCRRRATSSRRASWSSPARPAPGRAIFSVHSWIVLKRAGASDWTRYDVVGWGNPVRINGWPADGRWYRQHAGRHRRRVRPAGRERSSQGSRQRYDDYRFAQPATTRSGRDPTATASPPPCCARCRNSASRCRRTRSAAISATASMPAGPTAAPASSSTSQAMPAIKIGWVEGIEINLLGLVAGLDLRHPASSCRASAASASNRR